MLYWWYLNTVHIPFISDHRPITLLEGQLYRIVRVVQVVQEQCLAPHQYADLHTIRHNNYCLWCHHHLAVKYQNVKFTFVCVCVCVCVCVESILARHFEKISSYLHSWRDWTRTSSNEMQDIYSYFTDVSITTDHRKLLYTFLAI